MVIVVPPFGFKLALGETEVTVRGTLMTLVELIGI